MSKRIISSVLVMAFGAAIAVALTLQRTPAVLGSPLRSEGQSAGRVQKLEADQQPTRGECSSTAFIDYAEGARGKATPRGAVRSYRPDAQDLQVHFLGSDRALVEQFEGTVKVAAYEVFRIAKSGWLVVRADTYEPCSFPK